MHQPQSSHQRSARSKRRVLQLTAVLILFVALFTTVAEARWEWRDVRQVIEIRANGTILVEDTRTLWTDTDDFGEAFLCITHGPQIDLTMLPGSGSVDGGPPMPYREADCASGAAGTELIVGELDTRYQQRRVRFLYLLEGALQVHGDVVQWYWEIYGRENEPDAMGYHLTVTVPGAMDAPYDAYVHRFNNPEIPIVTLSSDRSRLDVLFDRIPSGQGLEIRYLMDPTVFMVEGTGEQLHVYLEDEARIAQINVAGAPVLFVPDSLTINDSVTVSGAVTASDAPIERVVIGPPGGELIACKGTERFTCKLDGLPRGFTQFVVLAYAADGKIGTTEVLVERR